MVNGALHSYPCPRDLGLEQCDPLFAFLDRKGVEVLLAQLGGEIVLATGKIFVGIHRVGKVGGRGWLVNPGCDERGNYVAEVFEKAVPRHRFWRNRDDAASRRLTPLAPAR